MVVIGHQTIAHEVDACSTEEGVDSAEEEAIILLLKEDPCPVVSPVVDVVKAVLNELKSSPCHRCRIGPQNLRARILPRF